MRRGVWLLTLCFVVWCDGGGGNATDTPDTERPHLDAKLYLPVSIDELFDGFAEAAGAAVATVTGIDAAMVEVSLSANPASADVMVYTDVSDLKRASDQLKEAVANGMHIKGVSITSVEVIFVADSVLDECDTAPCGADQTCNDLNLRSLNDFVCVCKDGSTTSIATPANCTAPHLAVVFSLPVNPHDLLSGFEAALTKEVARITGVPQSAVVDVVLKADPNSASFRLYTQSFNLKPLKDRIEEVVASGLFIAGVKVDAASIRMVAENIKDECDAKPCDEGQSCIDPDVRNEGDFVCSCTDGSYPKVGGPTPSCELGFSGLQSVAESMEVVGLIAGPTALLSAQNAMLHATHCNAPFLSPPKALHPTGITVGGYPMAGCAIANTAILIGTSILQHILVLLLAHYLPDRSVESLHKTLGYPFLPLRMFLILLPGSILCSTALMSDSTSSWTLVLGAVVFSFWLVCLAGTLLLPPETLTASLYKKQDVNAAYLPIMFFMLMFVTTTTAYRTQFASTCAAQRIVVGVMWLVYSLVTFFKKPFSQNKLQYNNIITGILFLQALGWLFLASGLYEGDGQRNHGLVDASVVMRFLAVCVILLCLGMLVVYHGRKMLQKRAKIPMALVILTEGMWVWLCVGIIAHWALAFGALLFLILYLLLCVRQTKDPAIDSCLEAPMIAEDEVLPDIDDAEAPLSYTPPRLEGETEQELPGIMPLAALEGLGSHESPLKREDTSMVLEQEQAEQHKRYQEELRRQLELQEQEAKASEARQEREAKEHEQARIEQEAYEEAMRQQTERAEAERLKREEEQQQEQQRAEEEELKKQNELRRNAEEALQQEQWREAEELRRREEEEASTLREKEQEYFAQQQALRRERLLEEFQVKEQEMFSEEEEARHWILQEEEVAAQRHGEEIAAQRHEAANIEQQKIYNNEDESELQCPLSSVSTYPSPDLESAREVEPFDDRDTATEAQSPTATDATDSAFNSTGPDEEGVQVHIASLEWTMVTHLVEVIWEYAKEGLEGMSAEERYAVEKTRSLMLIEPVNKPEVVRCVRVLYEGGLEVALDGVAIPEQSKVLLETISKKKNKVKHKKCFLSVVEKSLVLTQPDGTSVLTIPTSFILRCSPVSTHHPFVTRAFTIMVSIPASPAHPVKLATHTVVCESKAYFSSWHSWVNHVISTENDRSSPPSPFYNGGSPS